MSIYSWNQVRLYFVVFVTINRFLYIFGGLPGMFTDARLFIKDFAWFCKFKLQRV